MYVNVKGRSGVLNQSLLPSVYGEQVINILTTSTVSSNTAQ